MSRLLGRGSRFALIVAVAAALAFLVPELTDSYWLSACTSAAIYTIPVAACGLLYGRLGMISLAQIAFFGVGTWVALRLNFAGSLPFLVVAAVAGAVTAAIALLITLPAFRLSKLHFGLITLMAAGGAEVFFTANGFPNGGEGFLGIQDSLAVPEVMRRPEIATTDPAYFRYVIAAVLLLGLLVWAHERSKPGRSWAIMHESAAAAQSVGIDVRVYTSWAVVLTSFITGVGGALYAAQVGSAAAEGFDASASVVLFAVALMAGAFSLGGAVIGGALIQLVPALIVSLGGNGNLGLVLFGVGLVLTLISAPRGVAGQLADLGRALRSTSDRPTAPKEAADARAA
jgi:ABC-type branched-subunit amino acid transport system permease subunit